jgi:hypothetical protein
MNNMLTLTTTPSAQYPRNNNTCPQLSARLYPMNSASASGRSTLVPSAVDNPRAPHLWLDGPFLRTTVGASGSFIR